jgi:hypothetical protein
LTFELGAFAFPVALLGLSALLRQREPPPSRTGSTAAAVAVTVGVALLAVVAFVDDPPDVVTSLAGVTMGLATLASLLFLGAACRRSRGLPAPWARLPWIMGLALLPSMTVIGGLLAAIHERLLELPIVAYGVAWVILGYAMLITVGHTGRGTSPSAQTSCDADDACGNLREPGTATGCDRRVSTAVNTWLGATGCGMWSASRAIRCPFGTPYCRYVRHAGDG